jgi:hypothetical protein
MTTQTTQKVNLQWPRTTQEVVGRLIQAESQVAPMCKSQGLRFFVEPNQSPIRGSLLGTASKVSEVYSGADKLANVVAYYRHSHQLVAIPQSLL